MGIKEISQSLGDLHRKLTTTALIGAEISAALCPSPQTRARRRGPELP